MVKYKEDETVFITSQYEEKPSPSVDLDIINSVPMSAANKKRFDIVSKNDTEPFEFVQAIKFGEKYPCQGIPIGATFSKSWADSYADKSNRVLIPGSAFGHVADEASWKMQRAKNQLYVTGAKVIGEDTLLLRHYVSREMDEHEYNLLIKEIKAGLLSTSIYERTKYEVSIDEKKGTEKLVAIESLGRQRNDLVEWDQTGMPSKLMATSQKASIENNQEQGEASMTHSELIAALKASIVENRTDPLSVVKDLGLEISVMTAENKADLDRFTALKAKVEDPESFIATNLSAQGEAFKTLKNAAIETEFGKSKDLKDLALDMFQIKTGGQKEINAEIERIKGLESVKTLAAKNADGRDGKIVEGSTQTKSIFDKKETLIVGRKSNG